MANATYPQATGAFYKIFDGVALSAAAGSRTSVIDLGGGGAFNKPGADGLLLKTDYTKGDETTLGIAISLSHDGGTTYFTAPQLDITLTGGGAKMYFYNNVEPIIRALTTLKIIISGNGGNTGVVTMWARTFGVQPNPITRTLNP